MENKIKRLLFGFFILMLVFTVLSRAAAAAVVAKVQVAAVNKGNLTYEVSGTGIVKAEARKYINLVSDYKIGEIQAKEGQKVKKGDLLFYYDVEQLKEIKSDMEGELRKLQLQYQNIGLSNVNTDSTSDKEAAEQAVEDAKEDIKAAKKELNDVKKTVKESKEKEYKKALSAWEEVKTSKESAQKEAERAVEDEKEALLEIMEPETEAKEKISNYREAEESSDDSVILKANNDIFDYYYDGKYEEQQLKVKAAEKELERAKEDLTSTKRKWKNTYINADDKYADDSSVRNAYYEQIELKKEELETARRAVQDAEESLEELTRDDEELEKAMDDYGEDIVNHSTNINASETALYEVLTEDKLAEQTKIDDINVKLSRAEEDEKEVETEWEKKLNDAAEEVDELLNDLNAIEAGSYDYTEAQKDMKKTLQEAERALETAELQINQVEEDEQSGKTSQKKQEDSDGIEKSILMVDINKKQQELEQLESILSKKGKIYAPVEGVISDNDLEPGLTLTGQEKLIITTGGYELDMSADEDDMKYFSAGDEITIKTGADENTVTSQIENIELADQDGEVTFIAVLPEGNYQIGASIEFSMKKDSQSYNRCIPIQALRQDTQGTYVLLAKEKESVLGTIDEAFRVNVTVLSQDLKTAAIDASLTENDNIITGSNRSFGEGDRVRIYELE